MGSDKAFLELNGRTLLAWALDLVRGVTLDFHIVGPRDKFELFGPTVEDIFRDRGPLGGIHAALMSSSRELNLLLAVDLPYVDPSFLSYLVTKARGSDSLITVPRAAGGWQPLCAVYRPPFLELAEKALQRGKNKIDPLFEGIPVATVEESELSAAGFSATIFQNLNTPREFEAAAKGTVKS
jgi:molybdopterin-guanine dinucleotide biosynthesis protein A